MENTVVEEKKRNLPWFITKIVLNVIFYIVIIVLLLFSIMNINSGGKNQGFPNIFGKGFLSVQTGSMTRTSDLDEYGYDKYTVGSFAKGDLLYVNVVNDKNINDLRVGDVITFRSEVLNGLNSHRIVYATYKDSQDKVYFVSYRGVYLNENNVYIEYDGQLPDNVSVVSLSTQGDYTASSIAIYDPTDASKASINQSLQNSAVDTFTSSNFDEIKGVATGISVGTGNVLENVQKNWVFYFIIPVLIFLLIEIFLVIKNVMELKGHKNKGSLEEQKEALRLELEAEKEKMRQQILAELQANNAKEEEKKDILADEPISVEDLSSAFVAESATNVDDTEFEDNVEETPEDSIIDKETEFIVEDIAVEVTPEEKTSVEETANNEEEKIVVEEKPVVKKAPTKKATTTTKPATKASTTTKKPTASKTTTAKSTTTKKATATTKKPVTKTVKKDDVKTNKEESE